MAVASLSSLVDESTSYNLTTHKRKCIYPRNIFHEVSLEGLCSIILRQLQRIVRYIVAKSIQRVDLSYTSRVITMKEITQKIFLIKVDAMAYWDQTAFF